MSDDWYKMDPRAAAAGMARLTLEEVGAYFRLFNHQYLIGKKLPDDDRFLAGVVGVDVRTWRRLKATLVAKERIEVEGGFVSDCRANEELINRQSTRNSRSIAGKSGAKSHAETKKNNGLGEANAPDATKQIREEEIREESPLPPKGGGDADFEEFRKAYPRRGKAVDPRAPALKAYRTAIRKGAAAADILAGARRYAAQVRDASKDGTEFVAHASTWLNQERWTDHLAEPGATPPDETPELWAKRLGYGRHHKKWPTKWGPMPGEAGSRVPADLIQPGDGAGWAVFDDKAAT